MTFANILLHVVYSKRRRGVRSIFPGLLIVLLAGCGSQRLDDDRMSSQRTSTGVSPVHVEPTWQARLQGSIAIVSLQGGNVYVDTGDGIDSYTPSGKLRWETRGGVSSPMLGPGGLVYAIDDREGRVVGIDPSTGAMVWRSRVLPRALTAGPMLQWRSNLIIIDDSISIVNISDGAVRSIAWGERHFRSDGAFVTDDVLTLGETSTGGHIVNDVLGVDLVSGQRKWQSAPATRFWQGRNAVVAQSEYDTPPFHVYTPANLAVLDPINGRIARVFSFAPNQPKINPEASSPATVELFVRWPYVHMVSGRNLFRYNLSFQQPEDRPAVLGGVQSIVAQLGSGAVVVPATDVIRLLLPSGGRFAAIDVTTRERGLLFPQPIMTSSDGIDVFSGSLGRIVVRERPSWAGDFSDSCSAVTSAAESKSSIVVACRGGSKLVLASYKIPAP